jgi:multidrug resistance efflux pump
MSVHPLPSPPSPSEAPPPLHPGLQRWLLQHCQSAGEVCAGVVVLAGEGAPPEPSAAPAAPKVAPMVAEWPSAGTLTPPLLNAARAALLRGRAVVVVPTVRLVGASHNRVIALPIRSATAGPDAPALAAVALAVRVNEPADVERLLRELGQACAALQLGPSAQGSVVDTASGATERLLHYQRLLLSGASLAEGGLSFCTELAAQLGAERVSLAVQRRGGMALVAISRSAELRPEQALLQQMAQVMQESADQAERVVYPASATEAPRIVLAHAQLQRQTGHVLVSLPLAHDGRIVGALLLEWDGATPPSPVMIARCERLADALAALLWLRRRAERPWRDRLWLRGLRLGERLRRPGDPLPKLALGATLAVLAGATLIPLPHRVAAPAHVEGAVQRVVAAPFDGFLLRSAVRPGDRVKAGDVVAELADQDLKLEARKWEGALAQHENGVAAALSRDDRAQFVISRGKADEARAQLELVRQQLERTRLVAPIDGVVIQGDLSQSLGAPVQRGDALLTLAPSDRHRLVIEVDERDIAGVKPGQTGWLALSSLPTDTLALRVERVTPVAALRDGRNSFEVEAVLTEGAQLLRPGLQGVAKVEVGERSLVWLVFHRLVDALRLAGWHWLP